MKVLLRSDYNEVCFMTSRSVVPRDETCNTRESIAGIARHTEEEIRSYLSAELHVPVSTAVLADFRSFVTSAGGCYELTINEDLDDRGKNTEYVHFLAHLSLGHFPT